ncbi:hypothetical protein QJQ45_021621 [Haematococcus lacustris]|nr:hypothetical protein QJQ45_021621 [Haematococcus lacustris]
MPKWEHADLASGLRHVYDELSSQPPIDAIPGIAQRLQAHVDAIKKLPDTKQNRVYDAALKVNTPQFALLADYCPTFARMHLSGGASLLHVLTRAPVHAAPSSSVASLLTCATDILLVHRKGALPGPHALLPQALQTDLGLGLQEGKLLPLVSQVAVKPEHPSSPTPSSPPPLH